LEGERQPGLVDGHFAKSEPAPWMRRVPGERCALRLRHRRREREDQRGGRVVRDLAGLEVMLLVDVAVEDRDVLPVLQQVDGLAAVPGRPIPRGRQIEERPVGEDRKSTRLNSSHRTISYAVFCLKK